MCVATKFVWSIISAIRSRQFNVQPRVQFQERFVVDEVALVQVCSISPG